MLNILLASCCPISALTTGSDQGAKKTSAAPLLPMGTNQEIRITPTLDTTYLTNPGIGWQDGPESYDITNFLETVAYANRQEIAWSDLNPAKGVYDWHALDAQFAKAVEEEKQFSFRVYTFIGEGYGGNKVPSWVIDEGAKILPSGELDYSNCIYQERWGEFINELVRKYDGNPGIAFIDISGYGNFNEWNWLDSQSGWDEQWNTDYVNGTPSNKSFLTLDGQARRRLVDIFIGGSFEGHSCRMPDGTTSSVNYSYSGFQKTQLLMPYAGIAQSSQYVISRRSDVGFRYDCLGRDGQSLFKKIGNEILKTWEKAPVVYELCKPAEMDAEDATWLLKMTHGSIVHNNRWSNSLDQLEEMMLPVGYRYFLKDFNFKITGRSVNVQMEWQNIGLAPNYPKMGQDFRLYFCLVDETGALVFKDSVPEDITTWLPSASPKDDPPSYQVSYKSQLPASLEPGKYLVGVSIIDLRTGKPIQLAFSGRDTNGVYILFQANIKP